jgi:hypothetical protein
MILTLKGLEDLERNVQKFRVIYKHSGKEIDMFPFSQWISSILTIKHHLQAKPLG